MRHLPILEFLRRNITGCVVGIQEWGDVAYFIVVRNYPKASSQAIGVRMVIDFQSTGSGTFLISW